MPAAGRLPSYVLLAFLVCPLGQPALASWFRATVTHTCLDAACQQVSMRANNSRETFDFLPMKRTFQRTIGSDFCSF